MGKKANIIELLQGDKLKAGNFTQLWCKKPQEETNYPLAQRVLKLVKFVKLVDIFFISG